MLTHFNCKILGSKTIYVQGAEDFFSGIWGDQCIILRELRPPGGLKKATTPPRFASNEVIFILSANQI